jgi:hypothetical protein
MRQTDSEITPEAQSNTQGVPPQGRRSSAWDRAQRIGLAAFGVLGTLGLLGLAACPADLANPSEYDVPGAAGAMGGGSAGAGGAGSTQPGLNVDTTCLTQVFTTNCTTSIICHKTGATPNAGASLDLESPGANKRLIDVPATHGGVAANATCMPGQKLIDSAMPDNSWLLLKLTTATADQKCGSQMPIGPLLSDTDLTCVKKYIQDVADAAKSGN